MSTHVNQFETDVQDYENVLSKVIPNSVWCLIFLG